MWSSEVKKCGVYFRIKKASCEAALSSCWCGDVCALSVMGKATLCHKRSGLLVLYTRWGHRAGAEGSASSCLSLPGTSLTHWTSDSLCRGQFELQHLKILSTIYFFELKILSKHTQCDLFRAKHASPHANKHLMEEYMKSLWDLSVDTFTELVLWPNSFLLCSSARSLLSLLVITSLITVTVGMGCALCWHAVFYDISQHKFWSASGIFLTYALF